LHAGKILLLDFFIMSAAFAFFFTPIVTPLLDN
jgi:hypothetical protein